MDFSKFSEISRKAITKAHQMTIESNYRVIEPEIMLVSVMQEGRDMVYYILQRTGVDKTAFFETVGRSTLEIERGGNGQPDIAPKLYEIFEKSEELSSFMGCSVVALEHIFWAFGVVDSPIKEIMQSFSLTNETLGEAVTAYSNGEPSCDDEEDEVVDSSVLSRYGVNLVKEAEEGRIDPVIGRDGEIRRILQVLSRKTKNNPLLIGAPGTGKTAILEGLAHRIVRGDVPKDLKRMQLFSIDVTSLVASSTQGDVEARLKSIITEAKRNPNVVLFIDEVHLLTEIGSGAVDAVNLLKPAMARGEIRIIGATTTDEYKRHIEADKAFERRFQKIVVEEPDIESAITILRGIKSRFEKYHRIKILDEALVAAVRLSARYVNDRFLPDKAIDILDEAASRMRIERSSVPAELDSLSRKIRSKEMERESIRQDETDTDLSELNAEIENLREQENVLSAKWNNERHKFEEVQSLQDSIAIYTGKYELAEQTGQYAEAVQWRNKINSTKQTLANLLADIDEDDSLMLKASLDEDDIRDIIFTWTGIPVSKMNEEEGQKLLQLEDILRSSVIGQDEAVHVVSNVIKRNRMGFGDVNKPIGSFLFLGTTGVGKTELSKALAEYLFDSRDMIVRIDMSEYQQEHSVSRLFGAPPGYIGYDQGGQLTEAVRRKPYSVILLDEVEKAHKKVFETLLQVLDDGRMTDGQGHVVNFKNTIIIMTSNMGAEDIAQSIDENGNLQNEYTLMQGIIAMMKQRISPEFVNRIDEIVMFKPLTIEDIRQIVVLQARKLHERLRKNGIEIRFTDATINELSTLAYDPTMGARPVKRVIDKYILNDLTQDLLSSGITKNHPILIDSPKVSPNHSTFCFINCYNEEPCI